MLGSTGHFKMQLNVVRPQTFQNWEILDCLFSPLAAVLKRNTHTSENQTWVVKCVSQAMQLKADPVRQAL